MTDHWQVGQHAPPAQEQTQLSTRSNCGKIEGKVKRIVDRGAATTALGLAASLRRTYDMDHSTLPLFSLQPETKEIPLTQGKVAIVDASDYDFLMQWKWHARFRRGRWRVAHTLYLPNGKRGALFMSRFILDAPDGMQVDHIDGNPLNNARSNLRLCTNQQNQFNRGSTRNSTSRFKGVYWDKQGHKWRAEIKLNGKRTWLGRFKDEVDAARAYDKAAQEMFGEYARLNFPP